MMEKTDIVIRGMGCGGCVSKVSTALANLPGVVVEDVKVGSATILIDPAKTTFTHLVEALAAVGFETKEKSTSKDLEQAP